MRVTFYFFAALAFSMLTACQDVYQWKQKLTVTVQTPTGEVSGSSVVEVIKTHSYGRFTFPEARGVRTELRGEAVVVEVAPEEYLFVLLRGMGNLTYF